MELYEELRQSVVEAVKWLLSRGYFGTELSTGGNVSARLKEENLVAITPSGLPYKDLKAEDVCVVDFELGLKAGNRAPSVESGLHIAVYKNRPEVGAVVHTHQHYASVLAILNEPLPPLFDEVALSLGNRIEIVPYALSGTPELVENVTAVLDNGSLAYLLQNHGALCLGHALEKAIRNAELLEKAAMVYCHALGTGRNITHLPPETLKLFDELRKAGIAV